MQKANNKFYINTIKEHIVKNKKKYNAVLTLICGKGPEVPTVYPQDSATWEEEEKEDSLDVGNNDIDEQETIQNRIDDLFDKIDEIKTEPGSDYYLVLWNTIWIMVSACRLDGDIYLHFLKQNGIKDSDLAIAFKTRDDIAFQCVKKIVGKQKLKELADGIDKSSTEAEGTSPAKYRIKIIKLFLQKMYSDRICYDDFDIGYFDFYYNDDYLLTSLDSLEKPYIKRIYRLNQWNCEIKEIIHTIRDIALRKRFHEFGSIKSMEFPFSPFYSSAVELISNLRDPEYIEKELERIKNETIKDTKYRLGIIQDGIISIREGEHHLVMLWKLGNKYKKVQEALNKRYNYPLFGTVKDINEWDNNLEKIIQSKHSSQNNILEIIQNNNFWTLPFADIVELIVACSYMASRGGLLCLEYIIPQDSLQKKDDLLFKNNHYQFHNQMTYFFFSYGLQITINGLRTSDVLYFMNYYFNIIIQALTNHLILAKHIFCQLAKDPYSTFNTFHNFLMGDIINHTWER